ncbi:MAG: helix-turn-helix transcriptional regulator [Bacteroidota bacterium]
MLAFQTNDFLGATALQMEAENFKVSVVEYSKPVSEDWHWHEKFHLSSILSGGDLESRKQQDIQVLPGKVMVYDQGEIHRNRFTAHPSRNLNIELEEGFFTPELKFSHLQSKSFSSIELHSIYFELALNDLYSEQSIRQTLQSLFWQDAHGRNTEWIETLETLLRDRWNEFPSLEDLSVELGVHPITISKYFALYKGITLSEYMRKLKVERALHGLLNTADSLAEIAFRCGFSDQSHMTRLIKRHTGYTPRRIRSLA